METICGELNSFLIRRQGLQQELVVLSELVNLDGSVAPQEDNKVLCTLINIEQERVNLGAPQRDRVKQNPPINLNLYVLFSAYYQPKNYREAIQVLGHIIGFFQGKQVFTPQNTPGLHASCEKLTVEMANLDIKEHSHFWTALGARHLPSVLYKWRFTALTEDQILEELPEIKGVTTTVKKGPQREE